MQGEVPASCGNGSKTSSLVCNKTTTFSQSASTPCWQTNGCLSYPGIVYHSKKILFSWLHSPTHVDNQSRQLNTEINFLHIRLFKQIGKSVVPDYHSGKKKRSLLDEGAQTLYKIQLLLHYYWQFLWTHYVYQWDYKLTFAWKISCWLIDPNPKKFKVRLH